MQDLWNPTPEEKTCTWNQVRFWDLRSDSRICVQILGFSELAKNEEFRALARSRTHSVLLFSGLFSHFEKISYNKTYHNPNLACSSRLQTKISPVTALWLELKGKIPRFRPLCRPFSQKSRAVRPLSSNLRCISSSKALLLLFLFFWI